MQAIKNKFAGIREGIGKIMQWISNKYENNKKKCRGVLITLALLALLAGLIVGSYKSVDSLSQGVPINYTAGTILDSLVQNSGSFLGLNTYYYTVPNTNFLLTFNTAELSLQSPSVFPSITARTVEGIKVEIEVDAKVKLVPGSLKSFLEEYGMALVDGVHPGWQIYIKEKIRNVVVQSVAGYKFYQITNQALASSINVQFASYFASQTKYPFLVSMIGLNVRYPRNTMEVNDTLGIKLLKESSKLSQLNSQLDTLKAYLAAYSQQIQNYALNQATNDGKMASREEAVKIYSPKWVEGVQVMNSSLGNATLLQKYLEIYFNTLYNVSYRMNDLQPFIL